MIQLPAFDSIQQSDFWQFFHLSIVREMKENDLTYYRLQTGGFRSEVDLMLVVDDDGRMSAGFLGLNSIWVSGPPHGINPFALDITRGFINLAVGGQGVASDNFLQLFQDSFLNKYLADLRVTDTSDLPRIPELDAYLGAVPEVMRRFPGCDVRIKNAVTQNGNSLQIIISST